MDSEAATIGTLECRCQLCVARKMVARESTDILGADSREMKIHHAFALIDAAFTWAERLTGVGQFSDRGPAEEYGTDKAEAMMIVVYRHAKTAVDLLSQVVAEVTPDANKNAHQ